MKLVYLGTPQLSVAPLVALLDAGHEIELVVTQADKRRGRGSALVESPLKIAALQHGLRVSHVVADVLAADAELGVVVAFGRLIKPDVLAKLPMINMHFSQLPRWRGAAPVERAILAGDTHIGVDIMALEETLDTGPVFAEELITIGDNEYLEPLRTRLVDVGSRLLVDQLANGLGIPAAQVGEPTYADKLTDLDFAIDPDGSAVDALRKIRLHRGFVMLDDQRLRIHEARAVQLQAPLKAGRVDKIREGGDVVIAMGFGDGTAIVLQSVQAPGRPRMDALAWHNGLQRHTPVVLHKPDVQ